MRVISNNDRGELVDLSKGGVDNRDLLGLDLDIDSSSLT